VRGGGRHIDFVHYLLHVAGAAGRGVVEGFLNDGLVLRVSLCRRPGRSSIGHCPSSSSPVAMRQALPSPGSLMSFSSQC